MKKCNNYYHGLCFSRFPFLIQFLKRVDCDFGAVAGAGGFDFDVFDDPLVVDFLDGAHPHVAGDLEFVVDLHRLQNGVLFGVDPDFDVGATGDGFGGMDFDDGGIAALDAVGTVEDGLDPPDEVHHGVEPGDIGALDGVVDVGRIRRFFVFSGGTCQGEDPATTLGADGFEEFAFGGGDFVFGGGGGGVPIEGRLEL